MISPFPLPQEIFVQTSTVDNHYTNNSINTLTWTSSPAISESILLTGVYLISSIRFMGWSGTGLSIVFAFFAKLKSKKTQKNRPACNKISHMEIPHPQVSTCTIGNVYSDLQTDSEGPIN